MTVLSGSLVQAGAQGTAFTYQGRLDDGGNPANGNYDLRFAVYNAASGGSMAGGPVTNAATAISNGLFTVTLDFGSGVFDGSARWLDIGVRTNGPGSPEFTALNPRQALTPTPYAIQAANAVNAATAASVPASGIGSGTANINISGYAITASNLDSSATLLPAQVAAAGGVLFGANSGLTNQPFAVEYDTNHILGSTSEQSNSAGVYSRSNGTPRYYTNVTTHFYITYGNDVPDEGNGWILHDNSGNELIRIDDGGNLTNDPVTLGDWVLIPLTDGSSFTTIYMTNSVIVPTFSGILTKTNRIFYVDPISGNDLSAVQGNPNLPFQTIPTFLTNATIYVLPGVSSNVTYLYHDSSLIGMSRESVLSGLAYIAGDNVKIENISSGMITVSGKGPGGGSSYTNVVLNNVRAIGGQDGLYIGGKYNLTAYNSVFGSPFDAWADYAEAAGWSYELTNSVARFYNCDFLCDSNFPGVTGPEPIIIGSGKTYFYGGRILFNQNYPGEGACIRVPNDIHRTNGYAEFWNVQIESHNGLGTNFIVQNLGGATLIFYNCTANTNLVYDPSNRCTFFPTNGWNILH